MLIASVALSTIVAGHSAAALHAAAKNLERARCDRHGAGERIGASERQHSAPVLPKLPPLLTSGVAQITF